MSETRVASRTPERPAPGRTGSPPPVSCGITLHGTGPGLTDRPCRHGLDEPDGAPGHLVLTLAAIGYMALEVVSFERTYPNGVSPEQFAIFVDNPAARMLQGVPHDLDSVGALAIWDGGWVLSTIIAVWAILVVSRLMRGEEETQRSEMFLVGPLGARRVTSLVLLVVVLAALLVRCRCGCGTHRRGCSRRRVGVFGSPSSASA